MWLITEKKSIISKNVIFHEFTTLRTNVQEHVEPSKTDKLQFEVEGSPGQYSQEYLDESNDQDVSHSTPRSNKATSDSKYADDDSPIRSVDRLFQIDEELDQSK